MAPLTPTVVGVGVDLADPARLDAAMRRRPELALRLFTDRERAALVTAELTPAELFAVKEAVMKALGCGLGRISFDEIGVVRRGSDLSVELTGRAAARAAEVRARRWALRVRARGPLVLAEAVALDGSAGAP